MTRKIDPSIEISDLERSIQAAHTNSLTIRFEQNEVSTTSGYFVLIDADKPVVDAFIELVAIALDG
jgi:hypothetical protein